MRWYSSRASASACSAQLSSSGFCQPLPPLHQGFAVDSEQFPGVELLSSRRVLISPVSERHPLSPKRSSAYTRATCCRTYSSSSSLPFTKICHKSVPFSQVFEALGRQPLCKHLRTDSIHHRPRWIRLSSGCSPRCQLLQPSVHVPHFELYFPAHEAPLDVYTSKSWPSIAQVISVCSSRLMSSSQLVSVFEHIATLPRHPPPHSTPLTNTLLLARVMEDSLSFTLSVMERTRVQQIPTDKVRIPRLLGLCVLLPRVPNSHHCH